jgi:hypothetical protein
MKLLNKFYPHALVIIGFVFISVLYFYPVLQGKKIYQSDIVQYTGMAKEQNDFRANENAEPYWTNSAFGGMPTYQLGAKYPHDYIGHLDDLIRFLPRPADYLFVYFLGFYLLLLVLKIKPLQAFFGALAFGFSTYLIIILGVGHNAKALAIAYMPMVVAGVLLVYRKKYILGGLLTMVAVALEINANHFQMTYYLFIFLLVITGYYFFKYFKDKDFKAVGYSIAVFAVTGVLALGANATNLLATSEYAKTSTRSDNELTFNADGSKVENTNALSNDYITEYSYGISESLNLFVPRLFGGSNSENLGNQSKMFEFMISQGVPEGQATDFASGLPTYWGDQPIVAAPAYIGAVVFFLFILALFVDKRKIKYIFVLGALVSLVLSWGKNFSILTDLLIQFVPMYNKFRAVSSIQVILELCIPVLAIMGLQSFLKADSKQQWKSLWQTAAVCLGIVALLFVFKDMFNFAGSSDKYYRESYGPEFLDALKEDRRSLYNADLLRSGFFVLVAATFLWLFTKNRIAQKTTIILVGLLLVADLFFIAKNYVSAKDFVSASEVEVPFQATETDLKIQQDTTHYRVFEIDGNMSSARASYFHKSIGGYSAVKPKRMQQIFDYQLSKNNMAVLNMLNIKYIIQKDTAGVDYPTMNPEANGNAWFVKNIKTVHSADEEMKSLKGFNSKEVAIYNKETLDKSIMKSDFAKDTLATIQLTKFKSNQLNYFSKNRNDGFGVFSEMYYKNGWIATIDGKETPIMRVNYVLRGIAIPAGNHKIEFKFDPQVIKTGSAIALISSVLMVLLVAIGIYFERKRLKIVD